MHFSLTRRLLYKVSYRIPKNLYQKNIMTTPRKMQEILEDLKGNPYYDKYAKKITNVQKVKPEEFKSRIESLAKSSEIITEPPEKQNQYAQLLKPKKELKKSNESITDETTPLDKIMKVELIMDKSVEEITKIWYKYHVEKENCLAAVIPSKDFEILEKTAGKYPTFLFPLPRSQGYEFIMCQFSSNSVHFTPLLYFQVHKENAPECLTITHFKELKDEKEIILMRGEYDKNIIDAKEAQCLANQLQMFYVQKDENRTKLLENFTYKPDQFDHMDLVKEISNLTIS